jgi:hypothetical protein
VVRRESIPWDPVLGVLGLQVVTAYAMVGVFMLHFDNR